MARHRKSYSLSTRYLQVLRVHDVTDGMRRVTLGGEQLAAHTADNGYPVPAFRSDNFDDSIKLLFSTTPGRTPQGPEQRDGKIVWPSKNSGSTRRTYTVRNYDASRGELDVDFVLHGSGVASDWARQAQVGQTLQIAGPKSTASHPSGANWILAAGDATALPAMSRWLEQWPAGQRGKFFIAVDADSHRQDLVHPEGVEITWLVRDNPNALYDAITSTDWWDGEPFAWVAGESASLKPIRRWLQHEKGLRKDQMHLSGYWKSGKQKDRYRANRTQPTAMTSATEPAATTTPAAVQAASTPAVQELDFAALADLVAPFAIRTAVTIGLGTALSTAPRDTEELAVATNTQPSGLATLLAYLETHNLVARNNAQQWQLSTAGRLLADAHTIDQLSADQPRTNETVTGLAHLHEALVDGHHPGLAASTESAAGAVPAPASEPTLAITAALAQRNDAAAIEYLRKLHHEHQQNTRDAQRTLRLACRCRSTGDAGAAGNAEQELINFALYGDHLRSVEELYYLFGAAGLPTPRVDKHDAGYRVFEFAG